MQWKILKKLSYFLIVLSFNFLGKIDLPYLPEDIPVETTLLTTNGHRPTHLASLFTMRVMFNIFEYVNIVIKLYYLFNGDYTAVKISYMPGQYDDNV